MGSTKNQELFRIESTRPLRLSSYQTLFLKYLLAPGLAVIWLTFSALGFLGKARLNGDEASPWGLVLFLALGLGAANIFHRCFGRLKNVWLKDDELLVSNGYRTERIPLRQAVDLSARFFLKRDQAVYIMTFDRPTAFGASIEFLCNRRQRHSPAMRRVRTTLRWQERQRRRRQRAEMAP